MNRIFIALLLSLLVSCSESVNIQLAPEVTVVFSDNIDKKLQLTLEDNEYLVLNQWLKAHSDDWYSTSGRYPGGVYFKSGSDGIQITQTHVVIYDTSHGQPSAIYIQQINGDDLSEIRAWAK